MLYHLLTSGTAQPSLVVDAPASSFEEVNMPLFFLRFKRELKRGTLMINQGIEVICTVFGVFLLQKDSFNGKYPGSLMLQTSSKDGLRFFAG